MTAARTGPPRDDLAALLDEALDWLRQDIEHRLGGATQLDALFRDDDRPLDEDRMFEHEADELVVAPFRIAEAELCIRRTLLAQKRADRNAHRRDLLFEPRAARRVLEVLDDDQLLAARADHGEHVARRATLGVVVDCDGHGCPSLKLG